MPCILLLLLHSYIFHNNTEKMGEQQCSNHFFLDQVLSKGPGGSKINQIYPTT